MGSHRPRRARVAAALGAAALVVTLGPAAATPAAAGPGPAAAPGTAPALVPTAADSRGSGPTGRPDLTWAELQELAASFRADTEARNGSGAGPVRRRAVIRDPRGDAEGLPSPGRASAERARPYRTLADLTRVTVRTPARRHGELAFAARWVNHRDARSPGVRRQLLVVFLHSPDWSHLYAGIVSNARNRVQIFDLSEESFAAARVRPERVRLDRSFGPNGSVRLRTSTEWLDARRLRFGAIGASGGELHAVDEVRPSTSLLVGPRRR